MRPYYLPIVLATLLLCAASVLALPPSDVQPPEAVGSGANVDNDTYINANNILMFMTNHGIFGYDLAGVFGMGGGAYFPYAGDEFIRNGLMDDYVLYSAGLWLGGMVGSDLRVAIATYGDEYVPGPMNGTTYYPDQPNMIVRKAIVMEPDYPDPLLELSDTPVYPGVPTATSGMALTPGTQILSTIFNDADPRAHTHSAGGTTPLGIQVSQVMWASDDPANQLENVIFIKYLFHNNGLNTIDNLYISLWADPDLGGSGDDLVGCDTLDDIFFCYNAGNDDSHYAPNPPAVGFKVLEGPVVPSTGDTAWFNGRRMINYKNQGMTSFQKYRNGTDPGTAAQAYHYMQGLSIDGSPLYNGTKYACPGDPVTGTGDLDTDDTDSRMMGSVGPLQLKAGDSQYLLLKMAAARGGDRLSSIALLREILNAETPAWSSPLKVTVEPSTVDLRQTDQSSTDVGSLTFGYDALAIRGLDFDPATLRLEGLTAVDSAIFGPTDGFNGDAISFYFPTGALAKSAGALFGNASHPISVIGSYTDGTPIRFDATVEMVGYDRGDANLDGQLDVSDMVYLARYFFHGGPPPVELDAADVDESGRIDINDMVTLVGFMF